ncbi:MAG: glycine cleavage T C-terminal barrel domain-containing protein, partial [Dehalococcoidia bacterium]
CAAAIAAAGQGLRVSIIDDQPTLGGHLRWETRATLNKGEHSGLPGFRVAEKLAEAVRSYLNITVFSNATAFGLYEGKLLGIHHGRELMKLRCRRIVVATGAQEIPMVFPQNDLPGVLLSTGAVRLANLYGVRPGRRGVVITNNDQGLAAALELVEAGVEVAAVADSRLSSADGSALAEALRSRGVSISAPYTIRRTEGKKRVEVVVIGRFEEGWFVDEEEPVPCDFICLAPGFDPATALLHQGDCKLTYDPLLGETVLSEMALGIYAAGEVTGIHDPEVSLLRGKLAGLEAAGLKEPEDATIAEEITTLKREHEEAERAYRERLSANHLLTIPVPHNKKFVCVCEDVTEKDIHDGIKEGFDDVQTLKRYSTVSMGPCQGKMCLKAYVGICAEDTGRSINEMSSTTPRPPIQPVPMGALAGPGHMPFRYTSIHHKHIAMGGDMVEVGEWKRPHSYGSHMEEVKAVRERVGIIDVSTLGKLDVRGKDAPRLMDKVYTHNFSSLGVGRIRYGMICSDSGVILDDGTVTRLAEDCYYVTTGTGNIDVVEEWFKWWAAGTGMCVHITNVTPGVAAINVAGPRARDTLRKLTDIDLSPEVFKYMRSTSGEVGGVECLLLRIGFVGETGWEVHFPAEYGEYMWDALLEAGKEYGISPFGVEAQRILRLEKKHLIPGQDTDIVSNPLEADMAWAVKFEKEDFIGRAALKEIQERGLRDKLVGFVMENGVVPQDGVPVLLDGWPVGRVTSSRYSPTLGRGFGLAWVPADLAEEGKKIGIRVDGQAAPARVTMEPVFDPEGKRLRE